MPDLFLDLSILCGSLQTDSLCSQDFPLLKTSTTPHFVDVDAPYSTAPTRILPPRKLSTSGLYPLPGEAQYILMKGVDLSQLKADLSGLA